MWPPAHRVRSDDGLAKAVAEWVEINAASARGNGVLYRQLVGVVGSHPNHESSGEREDFIRIGSSPDGDHNMQASASRSLGKRDKLEEIKQLLYVQAGSCCVTKFSGTWINIDAHPIRLARRTG